MSRGCPNCGRGNARKPTPVVPRIMPRTNRLPRKRK